MVFLIVANKHNLTIRPLRHISAPNLQATSVSHRSSPRDRPRIGGMEGFGRTGVIESAELEGTGFDSETNQLGETLFG